MEKITVLAGTGNAPLAGAIARELSVPLGRCQIERFPDGEIEVRLEDSVRGREIFIVQPTSPPVNDHLVELIAFVDACRRGAAARVVAVVPYYGYARSDRRNGRRAPVMGRAVAEMLETVGVQHLVTLDLHSPQVEGFFRVPVENLTAIPLLADALRDRVSPETVVVSPDIGAVDRATAFAQRFGLPVAILAKQRISGREVEVRLLAGEVRDHPCVLVDDMISTGGTIVKGVEVLREAGARPDFVVAATHGLFSGDAMVKLAGAGVEEIVVAETMPLREGDRPRLRRLSVAPLLATAIRRLAAGESLRDLYQ
jgi:ribose-phosphate pyrophosphokinase